MNEGHLRFLASPEWARMLESDLLPWVLGVADLGDDVLEVGPGPGLTTDLLQRLAPKLTAVEVDAQLASALAARLAGANVEVIQADATDSRLASNRFSSATCFAMLHHMPSSDVQDHLFAEVYRMLRPGGALIGTDSVDIEPIRQFHADDVFVPVNPKTLGSRLEAAGFRDVSVEVAGFEVRFSAKKPPPP
jgi:SAM-dependent methyltransferase